MRCELNFIQTHRKREKKNQAPATTAAVNATAKTRAITDWKPRTNKPNKSVLAETKDIQSARSVMPDNTNRMSRNLAVTSLSEMPRNCGFKRNFIAEPPFFALMPPADSIFGGK